MIYDATGDRIKAFFIERMPDSCLLCFKPIFTGSEDYNTQCGHRFHLACLKKRAQEQLLAKKQQTCAYCNKCETVYTCPVCNESLGNSETNPTLAGEDDIPESLIQETLRRVHVAALVLYRHRAADEGWSTQEAVQINWVEQGFEIATLDTMFSDSVFKMAIYTRKYKAEFECKEKSKNDRLKSTKKISIATLPQETEEQRLDRFEKQLAMDGEFQYRLLCLCANVLGTNGDLVLWKPYLQAWAGSIVRHKNNRALIKKQGIVATLGIPGIYVAKK